MDFTKNPDVTREGLQPQSCLSGLVGHVAADFGEDRKDTNVVAGQPGDCFEMSCHSCFAAFSPAIEINGMKTR